MKCNLNQFRSKRPFIRIACLLLAGFYLMPATQASAQLYTPFYVDEPECVSGQVPNGKVYVIGDSIVNGTQEELAEALERKGFSDIVINAVDSRRLSEGNTELDGISVLERDRNSYSGADSIVIALGTNGGISIENIDKTISVINNSAPNATVYWVNVGVNNDQRIGNEIAAGTLDAILRQSALERYKIIDWKSVVDSNPNYISDLGVHPFTDAGRQAFAQTVSAAIAAPVVDSSVSTVSVPIPRNPPIINNDGLENANIPDDRLVEANSIPNVSAAGGIKVRIELVEPLGELATKFKERFGRDLNVFSGYLDAAQQQRSVDEAAAKGQPERAAPVGQSSHGWGLAVDLEQNVLWSTSDGGNFDSEEYQWLADEGVKMGWKNPYYKGHGGVVSDEAWHWEYGTTNTYGAGTGEIISNEKASALACTCEASSLTGSDNQEKIWNFFLDKGFSPIQAAGFMGNMEHESRFEPRQVEIAWSSPPHLSDDVPPNVGPQGQPGYGLVQWTSPGRKQGLRDKAAVSGIMAGDIALQMDYLWEELNSPYYKNSVLDPLMAMTELSDASNIVLEKFEVPADIPGQRPVRLKSAQEILTRFGSNTSGGGGNGVLACGVDSSGQVIGGFSLPVDKKWYEQHPEWFTKPHHTYPAADIPVPEGTPIYSMTEGKVISAPTGDNCGNGLVIELPGGDQFIYCHGSDGGSVPGAKLGDTVQPGQLIMHASYTGRTEPPGPAGTHLHVGITVNGKQVCPQQLFVGIAEGRVPPLDQLPTSGCTT